MKKYLLLFLALTSCGKDAKEPVSSSGVGKQTVKVQTDSNGWSVEQKNIADRLKVDNTPGSIKHLYIISPYSGQTLLYSTVKGKVTSGSKRLTPNTISGHYTGFKVQIDDEIWGTNEVIQDDGTYGSSCEYVFWFDQKGAYHQHFFTGGQIIHVSDHPLNVKSVIINMESVDPEKE